jgi:hypothetical protein
MRDTDHYSRLLGTRAPWRVSLVELDEPNLQVTVCLRIDADAKLRCPKCRRESLRYDGRRCRWRHLDTVQFKTIVEAVVPPLSKTASPPGSAAVSAASHSLPVFNGEDRGASDTGRAAPPPLRRCTDGRISAAGCGRAAAVGTSRVATLRPLSSSSGRDSSPEIPAGHPCSKDVPA